MEKPPEQVHRRFTTTFIDEEKAAAASLRKRQLLRCCSCAGATFLFAAILTIALIFTVFKVRGPVLQIIHSTADLDLINGTNLPRPGSNATIHADVSVKNRNFISFRYGNSTAALYYRGAEIGEARAPAGNMCARGTGRMNATIVVIMDRVVANPDFVLDLKSGSVTISWFARLGGRAKFLFIKKHVTVKMNCTATVDAAKMELKKYKCRSKVKIFGG